MKCQKLTDLVNKAAHQLDGVRDWAAHDGIAPEAEQQAPRTSGTSLLATVAKITRPGTSFLATMTRFTRARSAPGTSEEKDPDLTFAMRQVLAAGQRMDALRNSPLCGKRNNPPEDDDDDGNETETDDNETVADDDDVTEVNGSAVGSLLEFEEGMDKSVEEFETKVHPHGKKWWRYRYEYTLVECLVLAFSVMLLYGVMYLLHGVSFFGRFKFYNIGRTARLVRYAWGYVVFHAAATMLMVTSAYMLYMPWGESNIIDAGAKAFHEAVDGRANVPFLGYSWLLMILNVQFQLFVCFMIYAFFILAIIRNFQRALDDWKTLSDEDFHGDTGLLPINVELYKTFDKILKHRVKRSTSLQSCFVQTKLSLDGVDGLRQASTGVNEFKLHLYFTDSFGKALEYLVEVSMKTNLVLCISSLFVALLAHHFQVAFMYFLPGFIVLVFVLFGGGFYVAHGLKKGYKDHDHDKPMEWITLHSYCRSIQIVLYCVFFSFSRLLLSNDIFTNYPKVYLGALAALIGVLIFTWWFAANTMKETICAIILPPQISEDHFKKFLQLVAYWHTTENCHECGVRQFPRNASLSRQWAGDSKVVDDESPGRTTPRSERRPLSFR